MDNNKDFSILEKLCEDILNDMDTYDSILLGFGTELLKYKNILKGGVICSSVTDRRIEKNRLSKRISYIYSNPLPVAGEYIRHPLQTEGAQVWRRP